jgi:YesN/AraC family two-component response regulator
MIKNKLIYKVLLIDDDDTIYNLIKNRIKREGLFIIWAKNGEEGIKKANIEMPDLVITDIVMPKMNGFEVIKKLKEKALTQNLQFVVLSSYGETRLLHDEEFLKALGIKKYLVKSNHSPLELVKEIKEAIAI